MKKRLMITSIVLLIILLIPIITKAATIEVEDYAVTDKHIYRINPKTTLDVFKSKFNGKSMKIHKDSSKKQEVTSGYIGTNMYLTIDGEERKVSVIGDLNQDGDANQLDLSGMIRHILGFRDGQITDEMQKLSADITGDNNINNVDITALIRYNIFGEFFITVSAPEITNVSTTTTQNSVTISVTAKNVENGIYQYSYKQDGTSNYIEATKTKDNTYTINGLKENTKYTIMIKVTNKYGMADKEEKQIITVKDTTKVEGTIKQAGQTTWSNGIASIDLTTDSKHTIQYQVNGTTGQWETGNSVTGLKNGDTVYVRLWNGQNAGEVKSISIKDTVNPSVSIVSSSNTSDSVTVTITAMDNESGLHGNCVFYIKKSNEPDSSYEQVQNGTELTMTKSGLIQDTSYTVKAEVTDAAGNKGTVTKEIITTSITIGGEGAIEQDGNVLWSGGSAEVNLKTNTIHMVQYQVNGTSGTWNNGSKVTGLKHGDKVYARVTDGTNGSEILVIEIKDTIAPTVTEVTSSTTTNTLTIQVLGTDEESGIPEPPIYTFYIKETSQPDSSYKKVKEGNEDTYTKTDLTQGDSYTIKAEVKDIAGNIGTYEKILNIEAVGDATNGLKSGNIVATTPSWSNGLASVTLSTTTTYTIEYQVNSISGTWTTGTRVTGLKHGDTLYARLTDGKNHGQEGSVSIQDTIAPYATITLSTRTTLTDVPITATVSIVDHQTEAVIRSCKWIYTNSSKSLGTNATSYTGGTFSKTPQDLTLDTSDAGTYYLHVLTIDELGNKKETISQSVTVNQAVTKITLSPTSTSIEVGDDLEITATVTPEDAKNDSLEWTTSNKEIATVTSSGKVSAEAIGTATITATAKDGSGVKATCKVTVKARTPRAGDYVDYIPEGTAGSTSYTVEKGIIGNSSAITMKQVSVKWRIVSKNSNGTIDLIAERPVGSTGNSTTAFGFSGAIAYNNCVEVLNDICENLYSNSSIGAVARSIKIEDIQSKLDTDYWDWTDYDGKSVTGSSVSSAVYGETKTYNAAYYPLRWVQEKEAKLNGVSTKGTLGQSDSGTIITDTPGYVKQASTESLNMKQTGWTHYLTANYFLDPVHAELFVGSSYTTWIASRCTVLQTTNGGEFSIYYIGKAGTAGAVATHNSYSVKNSTSGTGKCIFPIVTLKKGTTLTMNTAQSGAWDTYWNIN